MRAIIYKILLFFRDLFVHLHVVVKLHIGRAKVGKEQNQSSVDVKEDITNDTESNRLSD